MPNYLIKKNARVTKTGLYFMVFILTEDNEGLVNPWRKYNFVRIEPSCSCVYFWSTTFSNNEKQIIVGPTSTSSGMFLD